MGDPRVPHSDYRNHDTNRDDPEPVESVGRPEVIREEVHRAQIEPVESKASREVQPVVREDLVRPEIVRDEPEAARDDAVSPHYESRRHTADWARVLSLWVVVGLGVVWVLLGIRLALLMVGASASAGFVLFIYSSTNWMVSPFQGIASNGFTPGGIVESATMIAMLIYLLAALILIAILRLIATSLDRERHYARRAERRTRAS